MDHLKGVYRHVQDRANQNVTHTWLANVAAVAFAAEYAEILPQLAAEVEDLFGKLPANAEEILSHNQALNLYLSTYFNLEAEQSRSVSCALAWMQMATGPSG
jgi:hypothetical protein